MKRVALSLIAALAASSQGVFASSENLTQVLMNSDCTPVRGQDGDITGYDCDGQYQAASDKKMQNAGEQKAHSMPLNVTTDGAETERQ